MTPLGEAVVFYLRYMAEMNRLCFPDRYGGEPDLAGLQDAQKVKEMARIVGDFASKRVADFLELCARGIEGHFTKIGTLTEKTSRALMEKYWSCSARVHVTSMPGGSFLCGVWITAPPEIDISLAKDACGVVVPWAWCKGGHRGEDMIWRVLTGKADSRAGEGIVRDSGSVALARIPIKTQPPDSFNVDRDPLVAEAIKAIALIGVTQATAIAKFVVGHSEPDEAPIAAP